MLVENWFILKLIYFIFCWLGINNKKKSNVLPCAFHVSDILLNNDERMMKTTIICKTQNRKKIVFLNLWIFVKSQIQTSAWNLFALIIFFSTEINQIMYQNSRMIFISTFLLEITVFFGSKFCLEIYPEVSIWDITVVSTYWYVFTSFIGKIDMHWFILVYSASRLPDLDEYAVTWWM